METPAERAKYGTAGNKSAEDIDRLPDILLWLGLSRHTRKACISELSLLF